MNKLEEIAQLSHELQEAIDERDGYKAQRDTMREELTKALEEIVRLRESIQELKQAPKDQPWQNR